MQSVLPFPNQSIITRFAIGFCCVVLSACSNPTAAPVLPATEPAVESPSSTNTPTEIIPNPGSLVPDFTEVATTEAPEESETSTETPEATAEETGCLIGKWELTDFTSYFSSIQSQINQDSSSGLVITDNGQTGKTWFTFNADGTGQVDADQFAQDFTLTTSAAGTQIDVPAGVLVDGVSKGNYTVSGDEISFYDQDNENMQITVTVMGSQNDVSSDAFLGEPGETRLYQYTCVDENTLSLKVIAVDMDFAPLTLTRSSD